MAGGGGGGNSTTRMEPPKYQLPYLQSGLASAQNLYNSHSGGQNTVAPLSQDTTNGIYGIRDLANSPLTPAATNLATNTMNGGFLGSNPYLDQTFNRAALQTQNQLASEFAGHGRNVDASEGLRSQQLNDLATGIYGGAYDAERNRQQQTLGMSPALNQSQYTNANALLGVGAQQENYNQQQLDAPGQQLDSFLNRVSGNMGQTSISNGSRNRVAGAVGGGMLGSQIGGQFGGNGGMYGGILGSLGGYFG
jgi:hypothetical protein